MEKKVYTKSYYDKYKSRSLLRRKADKPYLFSFWRRYLKRLKLESKLLDVGCGLGYFVKRVDSLFEVYGIDCSSYAVE